MSPGQPIIKTGNEGSMNNEATITREKLVELKAYAYLLEEFDEFVPSGSISWDGMLELIKEDKIVCGSWLAARFNFSGMIEWANGDRKWYLNGELHREDGPAMEWANGSRRWCLNGKLHREDGPAIEFADGSRYWYLNGVRLSKEEFNARHKTRE